MLFDEYWHSSFFENLKIEQLIIKTHRTAYLKWKKNADTSMIRELAFILSKKVQNSGFIFFWGNQYTILKKISLLFIFSASCDVVHWWNAAMWCQCTPPLFLFRLLEW